MNRIFLFDIDGTLSKNGIIPESAKKTLKMLRSRGIPVLLATGRCLGQMKDILCQVEIDGAVLNNGDYAVIGGKVFSDHPISRDAIYRLKKLGYHTAYLTDNGYYRIEDHPIYQEFADFFKVPCASLTDSSIMDVPMYSLGVYTYEPEKFDKSLFPEIDFVQVCPLGFDVISHGINKGTAVEELRKMHPGAEIVAFGDNYNDMEMLKASDVAIVMKEAPEKVKAIASFVTKDVFEDGIEYAVKEYLKYED